MITKINNINFNNINFTSRFNQGRPDIIPFSYGYDRVNGIDSFERQQEINNNPVAKKAHKVKETIDNSLDSILVFTDKVKTKGVNKDVEISMFQREWRNDKHDILTLRNKIDMSSRSAYNNYSDMKNLFRHCYVDLPSVKEGDREAVFGDYAFVLSLAKLASDKKTNCTITNPPNTFIDDSFLSDTNSTYKKIVDFESASVANRLKESNDGSYSIDKIIFFEPSKIDNPDFRFLKYLDTPAVLSNVKRTPEGILYADSLMIYDLDNKGALNSSTLYKNAFIFYDHQNPNAFIIKAAKCLESDYKTGEVKVDSYYKDYMEFYNKDGCFDREAKMMFEAVNKKHAYCCTNWSDSAVSGETCENEQLIRI